MTLHIKNAGVWKTVSAVPVHHAGVWKTPLSAFVKNAGVWKQFFSSVAAGTLFPPPATRNISFESGAFGIYSVGITLATNGAITGTNYVGGDWFSPLTGGVGSSYFVRFSATAGGNKSGTALNTWVPLSANRTINIANTNAHGSSFGTLTMELSLNAVDVLASATVGYTVGYVPP